MAAILATFPAEPDTTQTVTLGDAQYRVRLYYRPRLESWYVDIFTLDGVALARGRRVSPGWDLLTGLLGGLPSGHLLISGDDPYDRFMLGERVRLTWYETSEVPTPAPSSLRITV